MSENKPSLEEEEVKKTGSCVCLMEAMMAAEIFHKNLTRPSHPNIS